MTDKKTLVPSEDDFTVTLPEPQSHRAEKLERELNELVIGQERAVQKLVRGIIVHESGLRDPNLPIGPFFFAGPSGSGKTLSAEAIAEVWIGKADPGEVGPLITVSGENFQEAHHGTALIGAPHSYVGYQNKSVFEDIGVFDRLHRAIKPIEEVTQTWWESFLEADDVQIALMLDDKFGPAVVRWITAVQFKVDAEFAPFRSVVLLDEFEKMHRNVQKQMLRIFDRGMLKLMNGKVIDFRASLIIITSNIGTEETAKALRGLPLGFAGKQGKTLEQVNQSIYETTRNEIEKKLDPALWSRIGHDRTVVFYALSKEQFRNIITLELKKIQKTILTASKRGAIMFHTQPVFIDFLLSKADARSEGARQIRRIIERYVREPLALNIEAGTIRNGDHILFTVDNGEVVMRRMERTEAQSASFAIDLSLMKASTVRVETPDDSTRDVRNRMLAELDTLLEEKIQPWIDRILKANERKAIEAPEDEEPPSDSDDLPPGIEFTSDDEEADFDFDDEDYEDDEEDEDESQEESDDKPYGNFY